MCGGAARWESRPLVLAWPLQNALAFSLHPQRPHLENKSYAQWLLVLCLYSSVTNVRLMPTYPHFGVSLGSFESHVSQGPTSNICVIVRL